MFKGFVLRYLGMIAAGSTAEQARQEVPILLRMPVFWLARGRIVNAGFETEHADNDQHVHRLAYLRLVGNPAQNPDEADRVEREFSSARNTRAEKSAGLRLLVPILVLLVVGSIAFAVTRPSPKPIADKTEVAEPEEAKEIIKEKHPLNPVFATFIPEHSIALDAVSRNRPRVAPNDVATTLKHTLEPLAEHRRLEEAVKGLMHAANEYVKGGTGDSWDPKLISLHSALAEEEVPFYLDAQLTSNRRSGRQRVLISTYDVLQRRVFVAGDHTIKSLELTRLDRLNHVRSLLGYTRPEIRYAIVLVDRIERFLVENVLPSVHSVRESVIVRDFHEEKNANWVTEFETWAHEDLRTDALHVVSAAKLDSSTLDRLANAIVSRKAAIRAINQSLRHRNIVLNQPRSYRYPEVDLDHVMRDVDSKALQALRKAEDLLQSPEVLAVWSALLSSTVDSVSKHEVQHRVDYEEDRIANVPELLAEYTGKTESEDRVNRRAEGANAELSAYLSQIFQTKERAHATLIQIASFVMDPKSWRTRESYAALALFEALADAADISHGPLIEQRRIVRSTISHIYGSLRKRADLAAIAGTAWTALYGTQIKRVEER